MTQAEREALERSAERHLRRGELAQALACLDRLRATRPDDVQLLRRIDDVRASLQPGEPAHPKEPSPGAAEGASAGPVETAEGLASRGEYAQAIAIYRQLLRETPDSDLITERLSELFRLVQAQRPRAETPRDRGDVLNELLGRIAARKRAPGAR